MNYLKNKKFFYFFITYLIFHLLLIKNYPLNFEYSFFNGLKYYDNFDKFYIKQFFDDNANTFGFPFFVGVFYLIFKTENLLYYTKIISIFSYILYLIGFIKIYEYYKISLKPSLLVVFFLNPFIWNFGFRGTPDLFGPALAFFCTSVIINENNIYKNIFWYFILGIAIVIKPMCGIFYLFIFLETLNNNNYRIKKKILTFLITFTIPLIYFGFIKYNFNFFLLSPKHHTTHRPEFTNYINNLVIYLGFINLSIFPLGMLFNKNNNYIRNFIIYFIFFFIGFHFIKLTGEMDLGPVSLYIKDNILCGVLFVFSIILLENLYKLFFSLKNKKLINIIFMIFIFAIILSASRPAQRYLISIIPLLYILFVYNLKKEHLKKYVYLSLIISLPVNFILTVNSYLNSKISEDIVKFLSSSNFIQITNPGVLSPHVGYLFNTNQNSTKYIIESSESKNTVKIFEKKLFFLNKKLYFNYL
jgi:hypothetical protein